MSLLTMNKTVTGELTVSQYKRKKDASEKNEADAYWLLAVNVCIEFVHGI